LSLLYFHFEVHELKGEDILKIFSFDFYTSAQGRLREVSALCIVDGRCNKMIQRANH
jgi:hypothetical protein